MKKEKSYEMLRYGNFIVEGVRDVFMRTEHIRVRASGGSWSMRVDASTPMYAIIKTVFTMSPESDDGMLWNNYLHSMINVIYQLSSQGIAVDMMTGLDKLISEHNDKMLKEAHNPTKKEEKETIKDFKEDENIRETLNKIEEHEKK